MRALHQLLQLGYSVILSDVDAIWLQSPLPELKRLSHTHDMVFSRGNVSARPAARAAVLIATWTGQQRRQRRPRTRRVHGVLPRDGTAAGPQHHEESARADEGEERA